MSINSVQLLVKNRLQGLNLPTSPPTVLTSIVTPPVFDDRTIPRCYVWGSHGAEARKTMPRAKENQPGTGGFKGVTHNLDIWVLWFGSTSDPNADSQFPVVLEEVMHSLRTITMPIFNLVDPATGRTSNIDAIGEDMKWDYAPVKNVLPGRNIVRYDGRIIVHIKEWLQA